MLSLNSNALNWTSVRLDASLLGHDASPTTHTSSFQKNAHALIPIISTCSSSYRSYTLVCRLWAHGCWPSEAQRAAAGLARHGVQPPPSRGTQLPTLPGAARYCPLQVARPRPPRHLCGRCLPFATCSHCRWPTTYKCRHAAALDEHHTPTSFHSANQQEDVALKAHVSIVSILQK
jgi:hypothetical protein